MGNNFGFKCGIEIHRQLNTKKLFCQCPSIIRDDPHNIVVKRFLHMSESELGKRDTAALYEEQKNKHYIYQAYSDTNCLVELDEEPPHKVNQEALNIVLQFCKLVKANVVDQIRVMRKIVIDGSNTSGFQRTMLIATNGYIKTSKGKVGIETICLEEDSARKVKQDNEKSFYRLDRLGIPLIEIATKPEINDADHAKEVAELLGNLLRSLNIKRGLGTIRQDLNVSIEKGARVEIKGVQDLRLIPKLIENEVKRQQGLIKNKKEVEKEVRKALITGQTEFLRPMPTSARMYPETDVENIKTENLIKNIKVPELIEDKIKKFSKHLSKDAATQIAKKNPELFEELTNKYKNIEKSFIAQMLLKSEKEMKSRFNIEAKFSKEDYIKVLDAINNKKIAKQACFEVLENIARGDKNINKIISQKNLELLSDQQVKKIIKETIKNNKDVKFDILIKKVMTSIKRRADNKKVINMLKEVYNG